MDTWSFIRFFIELYLARWRRKNAPVPFKPEFDLATQYFMMGDYASAGPHFERRLEEARLEGRVEYARSLNDLALLYRTRGDYAAAEPLFRQAMEIYRTVLDEGQPEYARSLGNLARLYSAKGDYAV